ncbi:hypothetical protein R1flu_003728 [Riccia fluitans]|uniref:Uncharacterized protein n=1 Tax=Riccia fluitans TaxID=41844 RepID=A0ABD1YA00_9MARC
MCRSCPPLQALSSPGCLIPRRGTNFIVPHMEFQIFRDFSARQGSGEIALATDKIPCDVVLKIFRDFTLPVRCQFNPKWKSALPVFLKVNYGY